MTIRSRNNWTNWHHTFHKQFLNDQAFIPNGANLLISVSGGQDSMALMTLVNDIKSQHDWKIHIWHGDHKWHKNSTLFADKLKNYCYKKEIPIYIDTAERDEIKSEEKARIWRYEKLCKQVEGFLLNQNSINNWYILTGHTNSDSTETFLLNLARGSNYAGVSGIPKERLLNDKFLLRRPILIFSRKDTFLICQSMQIPFWEDPTNQDLAIKRNLIRHKVLPYLDQIYPGYTTRINQFIGKMNRYRNEQTDLCKLALEVCQDSNGLKREVLNTLGIEARSTIINTFINQTAHKQLSAKYLERISLEIHNKINGQVNLPNGLRIFWDKNLIKLDD